MAKKSSDQLKREGYQSIRICDDGLELFQKHRDYLVRSKEGEVWSIEEDRWRKILRTDNEIRNNAKRRKRRFN